MIVDAARTIADKISHAINIFHFSFVKSAKEKIQLNTLKKSPTICQPNSGDMLTNEGVKSIFMI
ncbi:hypothetical protein LL13F58_30280 [Escherichia coli]